MPYSEWSRGEELRHLIGFPSISSIVSARLGTLPVIREPSVISLRFFWEDNYFHALNDVLPRVKMANDLGVPRDVPVVVGKKLAGTTLFQTAFPDGLIDGRRVILQGDAFVAAEEVVLARPLTHTRENLEYVADLLGAPARPQGARRIFLTRAKARGRYIENMTELSDILTRSGIEEIDTDGLSTQQQVDLFSTCELVIGIHGAGLANLIFRRNATCTVLEIFPPGEVVVSFPWLADQLGFRYDALSGYTNQRLVDRLQPFSIDASALDRKLSILAPSTVSALATHR
jgi:capsular polysaccharide biosynthesis protein